MKKVHISLTNVKRAFQNRSHSENTASPHTQNAERKKEHVLIKRRQISNKTNNQRNRESRG